MNKKPNNIPKSTKILGRRINIKWNTPRVIENKLYGSMNCVTGELHLSEMIGSNRVPQEEIEITYWHEILHFIISKQGYEGVFNEKGIDLEKIIEDLAIGIYDAIVNAK